MVNRYTSLQFKDKNDFWKYVQDVANHNNIPASDAYLAIRQAWQASIWWRNVKDWDATEETLMEILPDLKPVSWEYWYTEPKTGMEALWSSVVEWIKHDIVSYPKRKFLEMATNWYYNWEKINTDKILKDAWANWKWKKSDKKDNKEKKAEEKQEEKKESGLLKFGKDATSMKQIETRDNELAKMMVKAWKTDISQIEELLNHYDSFKEASAENKQRTIKRIYDNIKKLKASEKTEEKNKWPQWIYVDQEDYKWTPEAKEWMNMYNKFAQAEAEKWDSAKVFKSMMGEAPTSNNTQQVRQKLKDAWLSTAQINDFVSSWADAYYKVDNESPINEVKIKQPSKTILKKSKK